MYIKLGLFMEKEEFMREALKEAQKAFKKEEVPVGAVIVKNGKIIARAHNLKESKRQATSHAEILAIQKASKKWSKNDKTRHESKIRHEDQLKIVKFFVARNKISTANKKNA